MLRLTRHGFREMLIGSVVLAITAVVLGLLWWPLALLILPILIWLFAFFRDPERQVPAEQHIMVSPADGRVTDITPIEHDELLGGPAVRIGIFLSIFNVHVNRSPCDARVARVIYKRGRFINAMSHARASEENESNTVVLAEPGGDRTIAVVRQIVGLIAWRIVCDARVDDVIERGQRIGMIKFGSRTELIVPDWLKPRVKVEIGQTVRGAADVVVEFSEPVEAARRATGSDEVERLVPRETPA